MNRTDDGYELSTGRKLSPNRGILGLINDGPCRPWESRLTEGYDCGIADGAEQADPDINDGRDCMTAAERREIAEYMIGLWREWGGIKTEKPVGTLRPLMLPTHPVLDALGFAHRLDENQQSPKETWIVVDKRTGKPASVAGFSSLESVLRNIEEWKRRQERGGRPDISREFLENLEPRLHRSWPSDTHQGIENAPQIRPASDDTQP